VLVGYASHLLPLIRAGAVQPADWSWAPNITPQMLVGDGSAVVLTTTTLGIIYNTTRVQAAEVPGSLADLLDPRYKGRIASYAFTFPVLAASESWGVQRTVDYASRLSEQIAGLMRCNELERLASGEFDLYAPACNTSQALAAKARGIPVDFVIPSDAAFLQYMDVAVPANARHPNAAKLFVNYLLGREAQDLQYQYLFMDSHLVPGSHSAQYIDRYRAAGVQFESASLEAAERLDAEETEVLTNQIARLLQKQP
jgi:ABC-type Fe3+ transport system substrate-binding protein